MPTLLSLAGVPIPDGLDGFDLLPWVCGQVPDSPRSEVLGRRASFNDKPALFFSRVEKHKWIGEIDRGGAAFNLERDPSEAQARRVSDVPVRLQSSVAAARAPLRKRVLDRESRRALKALGYLD